MSVAEASQQLLQIIVKKRAADIPESDLAFTQDSLFVGVARVGHESQQIVACSLKEMSETGLGPPLHSLVLPAKKLHPLEIEYLQQFCKEKLEEN